MRQCKTDHTDERCCQMAEHQVTFLSGEIEGIEKAIEETRKLDLPDEIRVKIEDMFEATKKELRHQRDDLI